MAPLQERLRTRFYESAESDSVNVVVKRNFSSVGIRDMGASTKHQTSIQQTVMSPHSGYRWIISLFRPAADLSALGDSEHLP